MDENNKKAKIVIEPEKEESGALCCTISLDGAFTPHSAGVAVAKLQHALQTAMELPEELMNVLIKAAMFECKQRQEKPSSPRDKIYELLEALHKQNGASADER